MFIHLQSSSPFQHILSTHFHDVCRLKFFSPSIHCLSFPSDFSKVVYKHIRRGWNNLQNNTRASCQFARRWHWDAFKEAAHSSKESWNYEFSSRPWLAKITRYNIVWAADEIRIICLTAAKLGSITAHHHPHPLKKKKLSAEWVYNPTLAKTPRLLTRNGKLIRLNVNAN